MEDNQISYTDGNGNFIHTIPYGWSGNLKIEKEGFITYQNNLGPFYVNENRTFYLDEVPNGYFYWEKVSGSTYKFTAVGFGIAEYTWSFRDNYGYWDTYGPYTTNTRTHSFSSEGSFRVCLTVDFPGHTIDICNDVEINAGTWDYQISFVDDCYVVQKGQEARFIDMTSPFDKLGRVRLLNNGGSEIKTYRKQDAINCPTSNTIYPENRILSTIFNTTGNHWIRQHAGNFDCSDILSSSWGDIHFTVVDCNSTATSTNFSSTVQRTLTNTWYSGSFNLNSINCPSINSPNSRGVEFSACKEIVLKPGFESKPTSNGYLELKIDKCLSNLRKSYDHSDTNFIDGNNNCPSQFSNINIYPNPNSGIFVVELSAENDIIIKVEVMSITGSLIDQRLNVKNYYCELDLSNETDGVYLVKVYTKNGEFYTSRVIKQK
ncbi:MAG: hypothetical protein CVT98_00475 [Bacteroidetes bacterium HGW-Bacteroidetes-15]|nr:MAG: hypothetical protein CVT98_00475 [Bacteroidetes bacterium HGW-Bacteroidetes-15]